MKKTYYIVIDLFDLRKSIISKTVVEVADVVGCHRNTLRPDGISIRGHHMVIPYSL